MNQPTTSDIRGELDKVLTNHLQDIRAGHDGKLKTQILTLFKSHLTTIIEGLPEEIRAKQGLVTDSEANFYNAALTEVHNHIKEYRSLL